ncbi:TPA: preprotein translocase subunit SecY [Candidatus Saccharibacteria bacterium]|nr:preprotein translocase subunit SecY [Candidatus Saccharibacteria bacterium]HIO87381.1 preprotein translocase subunit SecY [Candidatus Saccharibacteria bacterium]
MNWKTIRAAFKNADMRKKIFVIAFLVVIFRILTYIPVPFGDATEIRAAIESAFANQRLFGFVDILSGGALAGFSIMLMGIGPYINSSIIMQILTKVIPKLQELNKEGQSGRTKINQYTRYLTLPLAIAQSFGMIFLIRQVVQSSSGLDIIATASFVDWVVMITSLVAGSMLLMWIGELMSEQGVGNGISLIIFAGIVTQLPSIANILLPAFAPGADYIFKTDIPGISTGLGFEFTVPFNLTAIFIVLLFLVITLVVTYFVVKLNEAQRIVTISYAKRIRGNRAYGGVDTVLPIKLIIAGVIPIIFAVAFLSVPPFLGTLLQSASSEWLQNIGTNLQNWFAVGGGYFGGASTSTDGSSNVIYPTLYFSLVVLFSYISAGLYFNPKEIAENLQKQGGFVAGIRPGEKTEKYLKGIVNRLTLFGSFALGFIAILPFLAERFTGNQLLTVGGTGLLIVVSVAIESLRQLESKALMITYDAPE